MSSWKIGAVVFAAVLIFGAGYRYAAALYGEDIAALREDYAARALALEEKYRETERKSMQALVAALDERDRARADALDLRTDLDGLRDEAAALRSELSAAGGDPCSALREELAECAVLCARGAELLERGAREYQALAADKDALAALEAGR